MDLEKIKFKYSQMETYRLTKLVNEISGVRKEIIPLLREELNRRNEESQVLKIDKYLINNDILEKKESEILSELGLGNYIKQRLAKGDQMKSIIYDIRKIGIDEQRIQKFQLDSKTNSRTKTITNVFVVIFILLATLILLGILMYILIKYFW